MSTLDELRAFFGDKRASYSYDRPYSADDGVMPPHGHGARVTGDCTAVVYELLSLAERQHKELRAEVRAAPAPINVSRGDVVRYLRRQLVAAIDEALKTPVGPVEPWAKCREIEQTLQWAEKAARIEELL